MFERRFNHILNAWLCALFIALNAAIALAQTTQFTYQGQLTDGSSVADGQYDLQFKLFDAATGGAQQGATVTLEDVQVTNGLFSVTLDFGPTAFPGASRFLEIGVRPGAGAFTLLTPRQQLTSTPYAIRSLSAATAARADGLSAVCVNCVTSGQIGSLPAGNGNYIQNNPAQQQANSSFNISGNGLIGGNVGIGTTTPDRKLEVASPTTQLRLANYTTGPSLTGKVFDFFAGVSGLSITEHSHAGASLGTRLSILGGSGNIGIGTINPASKLHVDGGNLTVTDGTLNGNGSGLTNLNASNVATGTLATARGGTGLSTAGAIGNYLRSNGTNWLSSALLASDITNLSDFAIRNVASPQKQVNADFSIDGHGTADGTLTANTGVVGNNGSNSGIGVRGLATAASTLTYGVAGRSDSTTGVGVRGYAAANTGENKGVEGVSDSSNGYGVYGFSNGFGVYGSSSSGYAGFFRGKSAFAPSTAVVPSAYRNGAGATLSVVHGAGNWGLAVTRTANDADAADLLLYKNRISDTGTQTALQRNDKVGRIAWQGPDWQRTIRNWATIETIVINPGSNEVDADGSLRFSVAKNNTANAVMEFFGATGTLSVPVLSITGGADLSEQFEVNEAAGLDNHRLPSSVQAGMVVSIDPANPGELVLSSQAYDRRVAGIISGAGGVKTGMLMGQAGSIADGNHPVALTGRVYCWADATNGPIEPGDLLTTSGSPGQAMKVTDYAKAQGAIIGKAMTSLKSGKGLVLVLVSLQ